MIISRQNTTNKSGSKDYDDDDNDDDDDGASAKPDHELNVFSNILILMWGGFWRRRR